MEKEKKSKSLLIIGLIALCLVVVFVVFYFLQYLFLAEEGVGFVDYLNNVQVKQMTDYFQFGGTSYEWGDLWANTNLLAGYLTLLVCVILLIVSIVMACVKKNGWVLLGWLPILVLTAGVFDMAGTIEVPGFMSFIVTNINDFRDGAEGLTALRFSYFLIVQIIYALGCLFAAVYWIMCLVRTCKRPVGAFDEEVELEEEIELEEENPFDSFTDSEDVEPEPIPLFVAEPEAEVEEVAPVAEKVAVAPEAPVEETVAPASATDELIEMLKEVVRETVKEELGHPSEGEPHHHTSAVGGPLVVQYFNGPVPTNVIPHHAHHEGGHEHHEGGEPHEGSCDDDEHHPCGPYEQQFVDPNVTPIVVNIYPNGETCVSDYEEEEVCEPAPEPAPAAPVKAAKPKPTPVRETVSDEVPVVGPVDDSKIVRIPFQTRIVAAEKDMKDNYNVLKNTILSYGVKSRVSNSGDTFRLHRKTYIKITIAGKSLKLYYALDPRDYAESTIPVQDAGDIAIYQDIPLVFKVRSPLSLRRAIVLINELMEKNDLEQGEVHQIDWVKRIAQGQ
ncbi:MAG: hypothetical protein LUB56_00565 [Coprobacillus sp.]|nr:hypothetical protein [Coprobacillus sp.]